MFRYVYLLLVLVIACGEAKEQAASAPDIATSNEEWKTKIGQLLMLGFRDSVLDANSLIVQQLKAGKVGSVVLFDYDVVKKKFERNIKSPTQVRQLVKVLQNASTEPLIVAIDQEGGKVQRLKKRYGFEDIPSAAYLGNLNDLDSTAFYANLNAQNLANLGFNVNFAPVMDLNVNPESPAIGKIERSYSATSELVVQHASRVIEEQRELGVISVLKHFPGHGSSTSDSHYGVTDVSDTWSAVELEPYKSIISSGICDAVMTAHVFNEKIDPNYPATLSKKTIGILRDSMKFEGVIFSDDMQMQAVASQFELKEMLKMGLEAGIDIFVFGNNLSFDPELPEKFAETLIQLVEAGEISVERIESSYQRVMNLKTKLAK